MRVILCGCRSLCDLAVVERAVASSPFDGKITLVLSGGQVTVDPRTTLPIGGTDWLGEQWAESRGIAVERFPAKWGDVSVPGAIVRRARDGRLYNAAAGPHRNALMLDAMGPGGGVLAIWDRRSRGTRDMLNQAAARKRAGVDLLIHVHFWNLKA